MSDEQIIYLSPEEELTTVRERLDQTQARHIILVIPPQTQLRSHVGWRVLHSRVRELDKDILVISSDRQIRAVVKAAGFRVADSLESPPTSQPRPSSRPSRSNPEKATARTRNSAARPGSNPRQGTSRPGRPSEATSKRRFTVDDQLNEQPLDQPRLTRSPQSQSGVNTDPGRAFYETQNVRQNPEYEYRVETPPALRPGPSKHNDDDDEPDHLSNDYSISQSIRQAAQKKPSEQSDQRDTNPASTEVRFPKRGTRPGAPGSRKEPEDTLVFDDPFMAMKDDYASPLPEQHGGSTLGEEEPGEIPGSHSDYMTEEIVDGEIEDLGDMGEISSDQGSQPELSEDQIEADEPVRPSAPLKSSKKRPGASSALRNRVRVPLPPEPEDELDDDIDDLMPPDNQRRYFEDAPTRIQNFSDMQGPAGQKRATTARRLTPAEGLNRTNTPDIRSSAASGPSAPSGRSTSRDLRPSTSGGLAAPSGRSASRDLPPSPSTGLSGRSASRDLRRSGGLPPQDEPPTMIIPPETSGQLRARNGTRSSPLASTPTGELANKGGKPRPPVQESASRGAFAAMPGGHALAPTAPKSTRPAQRSRGTQQRTTSRRRGSGVLWAALAIIVILVAFLGFLVAYNFPTADVAITVPTTGFSHALALQASSSSTNSATTVRTHTLTHDLVVSGQANATGKTPFGTVKATGNVLFKNNSTTPVHIPDGTLVATSSGIRFVTTADALVSTANSNVSNTITIPIEAQNAGQNGNVNAGTITTIPQEGLDSLARANNTTASSINLNVTNTDKTSGGGTGSAITVTSKDINDLKTKLDKQAQAEAASWLSSQVSSNSQAGKPAITENPIATPGQGSPASNGTFTERLETHIQVLVIQDADLQQAANQQLISLLTTQRPGYELLQPQIITFTQLKSTTAKDGNNLTITGNATGQIARHPGEKAIQSLISGQSPDAARQTLLTSTRDVQNIKNVTITIHPGYFPWLPFSASNIHVIFKPESTTTGPKA